MLKTVSGAQSGASRLISMPGQAAQFSQVLSQALQNDFQCMKDEKA
jgi:hypothetical protein